MEDTYVSVITDKNSDLNERDILGYFSVFDGHGGKQTSQFLGDTFFDQVWQHVKVADLKVSSWKNALTEAFLSIETKMHEEWIRSGGESLKNSGSTAVTVFIQSNQIICANVGDSRAILCREGEVKFLSRDQRPSRIDEKKRLEEGGIKLNHKCVEINGYLLSTSRTLADFELKPSESILTHPLVPLPEIKQVKPLKGDSFIVLASDGLWDVMTNEAVGDFVKDALKRFDGSAQKAATALANSAMGRGSKDNISVVLVVLDVIETSEIEA